jgi:hypothetical protein
MNRSALGFALFDAGLLQYGRFITETGVRPYQHHLDMLASYPELLRRCAQELAPVVTGVERLLCAADCVPLATALALETGIPLVIGRGRGDDGARDFVGAYDIGHPAALVAHAVDESPVALVRHAAHFGLNVRAVVAVLDAGPAALYGPVHSLLNLLALTGELVAEKRLPAGMGRAVEDWLAKTVIHPRPD